MQRAGEYQPLSNSLLERAAEQAAAWVEAQPVVSAERWRELVTEARSALIERIAQTEALLSSSGPVPPARETEMLLARMRNRLSWQLPYPEGLAGHLLEVDATEDALRLRVAQPVIAAVDLGGGFREIDQQAVTLRPLFVPYELEVATEEQWWHLSTRSGAAQEPESDSTMDSAADDKVRHGVLCEDWATAEPVAREGQLVMVLH